jgi:hypothetical protein
MACISTSPQWYFDDRCCNANESGHSSDGIMQQDATHGAPDIGFIVF